MKPMPGENDERLSLSQNKIRRQAVDAAIKLD
jgi:hypothetical protein